MKVDEGTDQKLDLWILDSYACSILMIVCTVQSLYNTLFGVLRNWLCLVNHVTVIKGQFYKEIIGK